MDGKRAMIAMFVCFYHFIRFVDVMSQWGYEVLKRGWDVVTIYSG